MCRSGPLSNSGGDPKTWARGQGVWQQTSERSTTLSYYLHSIAYTGSMAGCTL